MQRHIGRWWGQCRRTALKVINSVKNRSDDTQTRIIYLTKKNFEHRQMAYVFVIYMYMLYVYVSYVYVSYIFLDVILLHYINISVSRWLDTFQEGNSLSVNILHGKPN